MDNLIKSIPTAYHLNTDWIKKDVKSLSYDVNVFHFVSNIDSRIDAVVLEQNNEVLASGWICSLMDLDNGEEKESYFVQSGKTEEVLRLLKPYYDSVPESVRGILKETGNYGWKYFILGDVIAILLFSFFIFVCIPNLAFLKPYMDVIFIFLVALMMLFTASASLYRKKMIKKIRKEQFYKIIKDILLCRIYMIASKNNSSL